MPGKFERCEDEQTGRLLWERTLEGHQAHECGSVQENGWAALLVDMDPGVGPASVKHAIVFEWPNGGVTYSVYATADEARAAFGQVETDLDGEPEDE